MKDCGVPIRLGIDWKQWRPRLYDWTTNQSYRDGERQPAAQIRGKRERERGGRDSKRMEEDDKDEEAGGSESWDDAME